jgi:N6-adenosine-specific RNA methylase IME4
MRFNVISADPPWSFDDKLQMDPGINRSADSQYATLSMEEIKKLDVKSLADPTGCLLALWVPGSMLQDGLDTMKAWGFTHKQVYVWVKTKKDPFKSLKQTLLIMLKKLSLGMSFNSIVKSTINAFRLNQVLAFGMGRLFRQTHEICLIGTSGKSVYPMLKNNSQRSVSFDLNKGHSCKPETLQDSLDIMFPDVPKLEIFARRVRKNWTCIGDGVTGKDVRESIQELRDPVPSDSTGEEQP